jgi:hypothetical protein
MSVIRIFDDEEVPEWNSILVIKLNFNDGKAKESFLLYVDNGDRIGFATTHIRITCQNQVFEKDVEIVFSEQSERKLPARLRTSTVIQLPLNKSAYEISVC